MSPPFVPFGAAHVTAIVLAFVIPVSAGMLARGNDRLARAIRIALAAWLGATFVTWYALIISRGWLEAQTILPMDLCDWTVIAAFITLVKPNQLTYELAWFWSLTGTLQAMLTPALFYGFPDLRFLVFFAFHGGALAAALYLTVGLGFRPYPVSILRALAWTIVYLVAALVTNRLFHTNFGYLSAKPARASLLDLMGPWPVYIGETAVLAVLLVLLLYMPFFYLDVARKGADRAANATP